MRLTDCTDLLDEEDPNTEVHMQGSTSLLKP